MTFMLSDLRQIYLPDYVARGMNILFLSESDADDQPTQHRIDAVAEELERRGHECTVVYGSNRSPFGRPLKHVSSTAAGHLLRHGDDYDFIVVNRDGSPLARLALFLARYHDVPFVFDLDDAIYKWAELSLLPDPTRLFLDSMLAGADLVTTGNDSIRAYAEQHNENTLTLPTPVDMGVFNPDVAPADEYKQAVIGWMGSGPGHKRNLVKLKEPLKRLGKEYDIRFRILSALGDEELIDEFEDIESYVDVDYGFEDWQPMEVIASEMQTFDIAALPLNAEYDHLEGKSIIKVAEHMAVQIPVVASDFFVYGKIVEHGETGLLSSSSDDWYRNIKRLIENPEQRKRLAKNGLELAEENFTIEAYVEALEPALRRLST